MPVTIKQNRPSLFGPDCVFAITDWKGFLGNLAGNYATVTGTLEEVETPFGTGIQVAVANSFLRFDWTSLSPLTTSAKTIFIRVYLPSSGGANAKEFASWGAAALRNRITIGELNGTYRGGYYQDNDSGGVITFPNWVTMCVVNAGINGGENTVYGNGAQVASGTNGGNSITTYTTLYLLDDSAAPGGVGSAVVGTIIKEVLVFNRVLTAGEVLNLHNQLIGA